MHLWLKFTASNGTPVVGGSVTFTDKSANSPTTWTWTFEGGTPSGYVGQTPPPNRFYSTAGKYPVVLTVTNANGTDTKTSASLIKVGGLPSAWIQQNCGSTITDRIVNGIYIASPQVVWATLIDGVSTNNYITEITHTSDGGSTWIPGSITFPSSTNYFTGSLFPFDDMVVFAAMSPTGANGGVIAKTTNGGSTWSTANTPSFCNKLAGLCAFL